MNLKRNDKIILIIGVVILLVAGAGIALYNMPNSEETDETEISEYKFEWTRKTGSLSINSPMIDKNEPFEDSYHINGPPTGCVLTQVTVNISWEDDRTFGLLTTKGADTLTAEVTLNGETKDETSELRGNLEFPFNVYLVPETVTRNASSPNEAASKLKDDFSGKNTADFSVNLNIDIGEPVFRLLKRFRDKGNTVDISVEYTYYSSELTEVIEDDTKSTGEEDDVVVSGHAIGEFYVNMGYGRGMI